MESDRKRVTDVGDVILMFKRHKNVALMAFIVVFTSSLMVAYGLPPIYRATATILIEGQEVPADFVRSTVSGFVDTRLDAVEKRVMSSANLIKVVEEFGLYPDARESGDVELAISSVRSNTYREMKSVDTVNPKNGRSMLATVSFTISFEGNSAVKTRLVANRLAELYIKEHSRLRSEQAKKVSAFIERETEKVSAKIHKIEDSLAKFKQKHVGKLPENEGMTLRLLERAEGNLVEISDDIRMLEERKRKLVDQLEIEGYKKGAFSDGQQIVLGSEQQLLIQRAKLESLRSRYSDIHPDVLKLKSEISLLEKKVDGSASGDVGEVTPAAVPFSLYDTVYQKQIKELDREIDESKNARNQVENKIDELELVLLEAPIVERDYQKILRDHQDTLKVYNDLKNRQMEAQIAEQLEVEEKAERLSVVQAAITPIEPVGPNRLGIAFLGLALAVGFGFGVVAVVDMQDKTIHGVRGIKSLIDMPVIAVIPKI